VAVRVHANKEEALVLGWVRGSEGKVPAFYQNGCWVIPEEALHPMEELPGRDALGALPPFEGMSL
jgi:hypothetical protein